MHIAEWLATGGHAATVKREKNSDRSHLNVADRRSNCLPVIASQFQEVLWTPGQVIMGDKTKGLSKTLH